MPACESRALPLSGDLGGCCQDCRQGPKRSRVRHPVPSQRRLSELYNHAGLRALQGRKELDKLVKAVKSARDEMSWGEHGPPPLLVKMAPDLAQADKVDIASVALKQGLDGLIVSNTTITRPTAVRDHPSGDEVKSPEPVHKRQSFDSVYAAYCCQ